MTEKEKNSDGLDLPYNADYALVDQIVEAIGRSKGGLNVSDLFEQLISAKNSPQKSYNLSMSKFLGLVESTGSSLKLTSFGREYHVRQRNERKKYLALNLPEKYRTILTWINFKGDSMTISDIKASLVKDAPDAPKKELLQSMVNNFARFASELQLITYVKGGQGRCDLTEFGRQVLSNSSSVPSASTETEEINPKERKASDVGIRENSSIFFVSSSKNAIKIVAKIDNELLAPREFEVHSVEDLDQLEAFKNMYARRLSKK
ncbi:MAG: hypothetical protein V1777_01100 [Candidatus Micrarchaeota archaeon]